MTAPSPRARANRVLDGDHRALAQAITLVENRDPGYRELMGILHREGTERPVIGVTGSPGSGKSTLVDGLTDAFRDHGSTVGILGIDPASPFTGGALLGDRVRLRSRAGDPGVFMRSMSTRGALGGLSAAAGEAITAFEAAGFDRILIETVGAGQNEVDVVRTADTVIVVVQPDSGDDVQMLKAGILEIGDVFVVNKMDRPDAQRTVRELSVMLEERDRLSDGPGAGGWTPPIVETIATREEGIDDLVESVTSHRERLQANGELVERRRRRYRSTLREILREEVSAIVEARLAARGGTTDLGTALADRRTDPYALAEELLGSIRDGSSPASTGNPRSIDRFDG